MDREGTAAFDKLRRKGWVMSVFTMRDIEAQGGGAGPAAILLLLLLIPCLILGLSKEFSPLKVILSTFNFLILLRLLLTSSSSSHNYSLSTTTTN